MQTEGRGRPAERPSLSLSSRLSLMMAQNCRICCFSRSPITTFLFQLKNLQSLLEFCKHAVLKTFCGL